MGAALEFEALAVELRLSQRQSTDHSVTLHLDTQLLNLSLETLPSKMHSTFSGACVRSDTIESAFCRLRGDMFAPILMVLLWLILLPGLLLVPQLHCKASGSRPHAQGFKNLRPKHFP